MTDTLTLTAEERAFIDAGKAINAIHSFRRRTGTSLKVAHAAVVSYRDGVRLNYQPPPPDEHPDAVRLRAVLALLDTVDLDVVEKWSQGLAAIIRRAREVGRV